MKNRWIDDVLTRLVQAVKIVASDRHKLVILLGPFGAGKTAILKEAAAEVNGEYLNLNLHLTQRLLAFPRRQYDDGVTVHRLIDEICDELSPDGQSLFVDNVEVLFSPELGKVNPVDTFKRISRQRPIVLALPARRQGGFAEYSSFGRADHVRIPLGDYTVVEIEEGQMP